MKKLTYLLSIFISLVIVEYSCSKNSNTCIEAAEPPVTFFQIKQTGKPLSNDILSGVMMYYISNGVRKNITDVSPAIDNYANQGILNSRQIGTFEHEVFYITYPNNTDIDTLALSNALPSPATNCQFITKEFKFNNQVVKPDSSFGFQPVYVCIKK